MFKNLYFITLVLVFTFFIFFIKNVFFVGAIIEDNNYAEQVYIDESYGFKNIQENKIDYKKLKEKIIDMKSEKYEKKLIGKEVIKIKKPLIEEKKEELKSASKFNFYYIPEKYENKLFSNKKIIFDILSSDVFNSKIKSLIVEFYEKTIDVRGKMKGGKIMLFGSENIETSEFISLFIHEFSHYIDLYYLEKRNNLDLSDDFYNISWESTKILKKGQKQADFVSGYSMTNKYEDFAESFTYFVLHNSDFLEKSNKSDLLRKNYNFFNEKIFKFLDFYDVNFSLDEKVLDYYWDITKISIKNENFLQYLEK